MKIMYVSSMISKCKMNKIIENSIKKPLQSIQKFHRLLCEGLCQNNIEVETISAIPMSRTISKKVVWFEKSETENGVKYNYIPFLNFPIIRQIFIFIFTIINVIKESLCDKEEKIFICDILNTTISATTLILSKIFRLKCIAIVTDLPRDIGGKYSISKKINQKLQNKYDAYIIVTKAMNEIVNPKNKPYIVIEGLSDIKAKKITNNIENKYSNNVCIYAGGLYERYGVKNLIDAFMKLELPNTELHLYGNGELEEYLNNLKSEKIKYYGVVTNDKIVEEEIKSSLLINPRFSNEEYTKYSFPSKNMEYMSSGTPVLTTKLPGMPEEYYRYIYIIEDESVDGIKNKLNEVLTYSRDELMNKGLQAREFVLEKKNNVVQTEKIIKFIREIK